MLPALPQELLDTIIDFLYDDQPALFSCSLVCHAWVPATRYHLFQQSAFIYSLKSGSVYDNVHVFINIVSSPRCTFMGSIATIVLNIDDTNVLHEFVNASVVISSGVKQIVVSDFRFDWDTTSSIFWITSFFPNVRSLSYTAWLTWNANSQRFPASFPNLHSLAIYTGLDTIISNPITFPALTALHTLQSLSL